MDGPTLTKSYNELVKFWEEIGEPMPPECGICGGSLCGKQVIETDQDFVCTGCKPKVSR